jgi:hypothetical protein
LGQAASTSDLAVWVPVGIACPYVKLDVSNISKPLWGIRKP